MESKACCVLKSVVCDPGGKPVGEWAFRQNDFNELTNCYACGWHAVNTCSLLLVLKQGNNCSRSEQAQRQFVVSLFLFVVR